MELEDIRSLYIYNEWANARFFEILETLGENQLKAGIESSFPSLLATMAHIVGAEWIWLERWRGHSPPSAPEWLRDSGLGDLRARLSAIEIERGRFLAGLDEDDLISPLAYRQLSGDSHSNRLLDLLLHVVNHSTYHRGQLTTMIRQVDAEPPATDYVAFKRQHRT